MSRTRLPAQLSASTYTCGLGRGGEGESKGKVVVEMRVVMRARQRCEGDVSVNNSDVSVFDVYGFDVSSNFGQHGLTVSGKARSPLLSMKTLRSALTAPRM